MTKFIVINIYKLRIPLEILEIKFKFSLFVCLGGSIFFITSGGNKH